MSKFSELINLFKILIKKFALKNREYKRVVTLAVVHFDGNDIKRLAVEFNLELKSADVIVGKNINERDLVNAGINPRKKHILLINDKIQRQGQLVDYIADFDLKRLRAFEKKGVKIIVTDDKKKAWMISQMFPFYCVIPAEPFQECAITAPIPITRNSDGYYFTKTSYRNQVTLIDLNIEIINDFRNNK
ncbi:MAG: hypothetical protein N2Z58_09005 [Fervidobacterium sp.]|nr:hypothetical protein [Fervidobacterium sp.]